MAYQKYEKNLTRLITAANVVGGMTGKQEQLFIIPYDMARNTAEMKDFLAELAKSAKAQGAKSMQLWIIGDAMSDFISEAKSRGITVKKNALLLPHFAPSDTAKKEK